MFVDLLNDSEWDTPFFKRLAHNDTGRAKGHQGGLAFPKDLRAFLPQLDGSLTTEEVPTVDRGLAVDFFEGFNWLSEGRVRYQFQTWRGTRSPESRLTSGMRVVLRDAEEGDYLLMQRSLSSLDRFRFFLIRKASPEFLELAPLLGARRWGALWEGRPPLVQQEFTEAKSELVQLLSQPFHVIGDEVARTSGIHSRIARSTVFRTTVRYEYDATCAVSGVGLRTPAGHVEVEAAHIVPLKSGGSDDIRNGFALTSTLHWAFDHGLFGIEPDSRKVFIPRAVQAMESCAFLKAFEGVPLRESKTKESRAHRDAFSWHRDFVQRTWG